MNAHRFRFGPCTCRTNRFFSLHASLSRFLVFGGTLVLGVALGSTAEAIDFGEKPAKLFAPYAEWTVSNPSVSGNPYDVVARVTFTHESSGKQRVTEMFYAGGNEWKFRFAGTQLGRWRFTTSSSDNDLNNHTGRVNVTSSSNPKITGFLTSQRNQYAVQVAPDRVRGFLFNVYMSEGPYPTNRTRSGLLDTLNNRFDRYLTEANNNGFNVVFVHPARPEIWTDGRNPRQDVFSGLERAIVKAHAQGMRVHIWVWGDEARGWVPPGGINSTEDRRLQRYIASRLGPVAGWTMGYGFDLQEWVTEQQTKAWADYVHARMGWQHLLWARGRSNGSLDVVSYSGFNVRDYNRISRDMDSDRSRPHFYEERHTYRRNGQLDMQGTRRFLWDQALAGGMGGFWGFFDRGGAERPPYPNPEQLRTHFAFWHTRGRFILGMERAPDRTDGVALETPNGRNFIFYKRSADQIRINLSGASGNLRAVAVDTTRGYQEVDVGTLEPREHVWRAPRRSDWAIAVGQFNGQSSAGTPGGNTGGGNMGSGNMGSGNTGSGNMGSGNTGSGNMGSGNTGSGNMGSGNTGSGNTGSGNMGSGNTGGGGDDGEGGGSTSFEDFTVGDSEGGGCAVGSTTAHGSNLAFLIAGFALLIRRRRR